MPNFAAVVSSPDFKSHADLDLRRGRGALSRALIGNSGFVGGNLRRQAGFESFYNYGDFHDIARGDVGLAVGAGPPAASGTD